MDEQERKLIDRIRSGEADAYAELVRAHHAPILVLCASLLKDKFEAEDAAQEVFVKAYRSLDRFKGDASFSSWIYRIASNHCLDILRRRTREKTDSLDQIFEEGVILHRQAFTAPSDAGVAENTDLIHRALNALSPDYRLILTLRELQGLNYKELSETLECSVDAVKARLKRARKNLQDVARHILEPDNV